MARREKRTSGLTTFVVILLILTVIAATGYVLWLCIDIVNQPAEKTAIAEPIVLPAPATEPITPPTTIPTYPTEKPPVGELLNDSPSGYVCVGLRPTERSAEDRYFYAVLPDQDAAIAAIEKAEALRIDGKATNGEALTGLMVEYQNGLWCFTESGAMCNPWERVEPEDAAEIYALCMDTAKPLGFRDAIAPGDLRNITSATMKFDDQPVTITDAAALSKLEGWLTNSKAMGPGGAACWFTAFLTLEMEGGETVTIAIATDSCSTWMTEGVAYDYHVENEELFGLFSMKAPDEE